MIIFLYGEDTFRSREKLGQIKAKFTAEVDKGANSLDVLDGEKASLENINEAVAAPSLFAKRRMVVLENVFKNKDKDLPAALAGYLEKKNDGADSRDTIIVFWEDSALEKSKNSPLFRLLAKEKIVQEFKALNNTETANWIRSEAKRRQGVIRVQAAVQLAAIFGNDLWQLSNEINKLISFKRGSQPGLIDAGEAVDIELADVENLVRGSADENIFALTDAIGARNKGKALELLDNEFKAGVGEAYLLSMIIRQFRILLQVKAAVLGGSTARKIQNELKLHPYVAQKASAQAGNFSLSLLKRLYRGAVEIDYGLKSGRLDARTALAAMIAGI